ncbi:MAG: hypothetical protein OHK0039_14840 [Bacteroidia bacterium]
MPSFQSAIEDFLAQKHIAIAGVSRTPGAAANAIYQKFRDNGYAVFAINPEAQQIGDITCYPNLRAVPVQLDGVFCLTPPAATEALVRECAELGIPRVWIHGSVDRSSYSEEAVRYGKSRGIRIIPAACPMMYLRPDVVHRCMHWVMSRTGRFPKQLPDMPVSA